ncbi:MAG TPA: DUF1638 domain-containing protein [Chloroflexota bacterium]|nr:DUF1638 domain-containing protein [Chloroflexota bacterium]
MPRAEVRPLRLKVLACEVLARHVYQRAATSPNAIDVELLEKSLHEDAAALRAELQRRIDATPAPPYDAIVLVYGLCNRATEGLVARSAPLVMARAHDCITLYLGSRERYEAEFETHPGTYYFSADYLERGKNGSLGGGEQDDSGMAFSARLPTEYEALARRYGEDNARYLAEVYGAWQRHYDRAAFIDLPCSRCPTESPGGCEHAAPYRRRAARMAEKNGWQYVHLEGDLGLVDRLLDGAWSSPGVSSPDILVIPPGMAIFASFDERVMVAAQQP